MMLASLTKPTGTELFRQIAPTTQGVETQSLVTMKFAVTLAIVRHKLAQPFPFGCPAKLVRWSRFSGQAVKLIPA